MEANKFVANLRADGTQNDECDLEKVHKAYHCLLSKIPPKERGTFSLNILCILCRNLEKVPSWMKNIDKKFLLILSIDCLRETRGIDRENRLKTLACIYHLHKHVVRQTTAMPSELVLKLSMMAFESDTKDLLLECSKTYWNIIADRISYIESIKGKMSVTILLPKLAEDLIKVIEIYDTVHLSLNLLSYMLRKLYFIFNDKCDAELNNVYAKIFEKINKKNDLRAFKKMQHKELLEVYAKLCDCLYIITENGIKVGFSDFPLENVVRIAINLIGHSPDIFHCLQTFYLNAVCCLFKDTSNLSYAATILNNILLSFETTEKLGYDRAMFKTYPFLSQFVKLHIEYSAREKINEETQIKLLQIIQVLMRKLKCTEQFLKCDNCTVKSGLHDALHLSIQAKTLITTCIQQKIDLINILPIFYNILKDQYGILTQLGQKGCRNYSKCFRKFQTDVHNTAIQLNTPETNAYARRLFYMYIKNEVLHFKSDSDMKNIARALYNKSISELDYRLYEEALTDAYLSQIFAQDLNTDKYMNLIMDVKAKASKSVEEKDDLITDNLQLMTVVDACRIALECSFYGNLKPFFTRWKFSDILKHEFSLYAKSWPAVVPIAGVCKTILGMYKGKYEIWMNPENQHEILNTLLKIVLETPSVVRTVRNEHFSKVNLELISIMERQSHSIDHDVVYATLMFLKSESDFAEASEKYGWNVAEPNLNPDEFKAIRTYQQEYACTRSAIEAVRVWTDLVANLKNVTNTTWLRFGLRVAEVYVQQLLRLEYVAYGLHLAHLCCKIADFIDDKLSYVRNAGTILYFMDKTTDEVNALLKSAGEKHKELLKDETSKETAIIFICDCAIHYSRCKSKSASSKLVLFAQAQIIAAQESSPHLKLDLAIGRLLEAQLLLCHDTGPSALSTVNMIQRHYLLVTNSASNWASRRLRSLTQKRHTVAASLQAVRLSRALHMWRRARSAAGAVLPATGAHAQARLFALITNAWKMDEAQAEIDNRLKYILGLQPSNETQPDPTRKRPDVVLADKTEIETMRDNSVLLKKTQVSPSLPCDTVESFKIPDFLLHDKRCRCYSCQTPSCYAMTCRTFCLEASMYFKAKEYEIAGNYFAGVFKILNIFEGKLKNVIDGYRRKLQGYIVDFVDKMLFDEFKNVYLEVLLDASYFELAKGRYDIVDSYIINIHEILQDLNTFDQYLNNNVSNLMIASASIRKIVRKPTELGVESDFECLTLSPAKSFDVFKTPDSKRLPVDVKTDRIVYKNEDIPKKRRIVTKFRLDDESSDENAGKDKKFVEDDFKVPTLVARKHVLESATPVPNRSTLRINITQPSPSTVNPNISYIGTPLYKGILKNPKAFQCYLNDESSDTEARDNETVGKDFEDSAVFSPKSIFKTAKKTWSIPKIIITPATPSPVLSNRLRRRLPYKGPPIYDNDVRRQTTIVKRNTRLMIRLPISPERDVNPRPSKTKLELVDGTMEFFTPKEIPDNQYLSPYWNPKTYSKKGLKSNVVKNLEKDFVDKENKKESNSRRKALQRATSPGKLTVPQRTLRKTRMKLDD